ncbi:1578_t:CDS:2 [Paraglomus brasilianum]|uniref:Octanoyltransferase n=1 Tax=Paraglomus brasilianum TaxID=144538 RepID=A0A9N8ZMC2_9GLOM|nr:1578_t:CDS:2 [Paraglomus brasilianum]
MNSLILPYIYLSKIQYGQALRLQNHLVQARFKPHDAIKKSLNRNEYSTTDLLILLQHPHTYTTGRRDKGRTSKDEERLRGLGADYYETLRGGQMTFHGPGQLVGYPILDLNNYELSVRDYVAGIERTIINTCAELDIDAKVTKDTGVWVGDEKICAIGIQVRRYLTMHGFALNCNNDMRWFEHIVPCGLQNKGTTSISLVKNEDVTVENVIPVLCKNFGQVFDRTVKPLVTVRDSFRYLVELLESSNIIEVPLQQED